MSAPQQPLIEYNVFAFAEDDTYLEPITSLLKAGKVHNFGFDSEEYEREGDDDEDDIVWDDRTIIAIAIPIADAKTHNLLAPQAVKWWANIKCASPQRGAELFQNYLDTMEKFDGLYVIPYGVFPDELAVKEHNIKPIRGITSDWRESFIPPPEPSRPGKPNDVISRYRRQPKWWQEKMRAAIRNVEAGKAAKKAEL